MRRLVWSVLLGALVLLCVPAASWAQPATEGRWAPAKWEFHDPGWNLVRTLAADGDTMWVATDAGVKRCHWYTIRDYRRYTVADGLASNQVDCIAVGPDGVVWFATSAGLSRYERGVWASYTTANSDIPYNEVAEVATTPDGAVWLRSSVGGRGLTRFDGSTWYTYTQANSGLAHNTVSALAVDRNGAVWCGTRCREYVYHDGSFYDTGKGVCRFDGSNWATITKADGLVTDRIDAIFVDCHGDVWVQCADVYYSTPLDSFTTPGGVAHYDGYQWTQTGGQLLSLTCDPRGVVWASSGGAICNLFGGQFRSVLGGNFATSLACDSQGRIWLAWRGYGDFYGPRMLALTDGTEVYPQGDGPFPSPPGLALDTEGAILVGSRYYLQSFDGVSWQALEETPYLGAPSGQGGYRGTSDRLVVDARGRLWIAGRSTATGSWSPLWRDASGWHVVEDPVAGTAITSLMADGDELWLGHASGAISRWDDVTWRAYWTDQPSLPPNQVTALAADGHGCVWAASSARGFGVSSCRNDTWTHIPFAADGLGGERAVGADWHVDGIAVAADGAVWFAGAAFVSRYDGASWQTYYSEAVGLSGSDAVSLLADAQGRVWVYGQPGQLCYHQDGAWHLEPIPAPFDGLDIKNMLEASDGRLWLTTNRGVFAITPAYQAETSFVPLVQQELVQGLASYKEFPIGEQTGVFTYTFEARLLTWDAESMVGLCAGEAFSYKDLACIVRFRDDRRIDVRDGSAYVLGTQSRYAPGEWHRFRLVVDVPNHRYRVYHTPPNVGERAIGQLLRFRPEQANVALLDHWAIWSSNGQLQVRDVRLE